jgi:polar amino acid transport system substrate-binding protein
MKKTAVLCISFFLITLLSWSDIISLRADVWEPYNGEPDSEMPGYMIEIAQIVFKKAGHEIDYAVLPWSRAVELARIGTVNAIVGALKGDAPDFVFPDREAGVSKQGFYILPVSKWAYTGIKSLESQTLGAIADYSYGEDVDEYIAKFKKDNKKIQLVHGETALETNIKKLERGRITVIIEDEAVMDNYLAKTGRTNKLVKAGTAASEMLYIAFSPSLSKSANYAKILSNGIDELRKSGELEKILKKYGLIDWR